ncbi:aminotransferase class V-fold PLP-dependent enzyme [Candidatus Pelagibacter sp.]|nr:aminotransferase class V-fold PLP-dependent enzyme [Candidatus Pelagibacter sp.]
MSNIKLKNLIVEENLSLKYALKVIDLSGLEVCFVTKKNKLINIITDGDIRRALLKGNKLSDNIKKIKSKKNYITVKENYNFLDLQKKISKYKIIPIINDSGEIIDYANEKRFRQLPQSEPSFRGNELKYVSEAIKSGWISSIGKYVNIFQRKFGSFVKNKYCLTTSSGTTAIQLAISTLKLKPKDEIIVPDYTFVSPINSIIHSNCKPVLVDIDNKNLCLSLDSIKRVVTKNTKAIIIVHLYGNTPDLDKIIKFCQQKSIKIIEDCAEAFGTYYNGNHVGNFGHFGTFSFFGNKTISTGEGGMITFKKKEDYLLAKKLRDHGMNQDKKYWHDEVGFNFRMTNLQAAIGCAQIEKANKFINRKIQIFKRYNSKLKNLKFVDMVKKSSKIKNSHWLTFILVKNNSIRDKLLLFLNSKGIEVRSGFYSAHQMDIYKNFKNKKVDYSNSKKISSSIITLPSSVSLKNQEIDYICKLIKSFFK